MVHVLRSYALIMPTQLTLTNPVCKNSMQCNSVLVALRRNFRFDLNYNYGSFLKNSDKRPCLRISSARKQFSQQSTLPTLTMYTKEECSLCDEMVKELQPYWNQFIFETVDITEESNEEWFELYRYDIPVLHLNGRLLMKHRFNPPVLERQLAKIQNHVDKKD